MTRTRLHDPGQPRRAATPAHPVVEVVVCGGTRCRAASADGAGGHETLLRAGADGSPAPVRVRAAGCLTACPLGPVVVVRRHVAHGSARSRPRTTWLALLSDDAAVAALAGWLASGARGALPDVVRRHEMPVPEGRPVC